MTPFRITETYRLPLLEPSRETGVIKYLVLACEYSCARRSVEHKYKNLEIKELIVIS